MANLKSNAFVTKATVLAAGITAGSVALLSSISASGQAQNASFPDTQNYWAQPFIATLAERNIVKGYPDGTYRPNATVDRDEFAAMLRAAFNEPAERRIGSGSDYRDVPQGYWAAPAIKEAYEAGFMNGYPGGYFRPQQPVTRAEALASFAQTLNLNPKVPANTQATAQPQNTQATAQPQNTQATAQTAPQRRRGIMLPLASLALLQPFVTPIRQAAAAVPTPQKATAIAKASTPQAQQRPLQLKQYYTDADRIPKFAERAVENATRSNLVVNHPNVRELNPQRPATRGEIAAIVHQALVNQGKLPALSQDVPASQYVVKAENVVQSR